jgi:predicted ABC-type transport system involved in lysophospholipase L1 biosynthesis ATPase subunit
MSESDSQLELKRVGKRYESGSDAPPLEILKGVDLRLAAGESLAVVGPSGSGKSTLLNVMGALDTPSSGEVLLENQALSSLNDDQLADLRNRKLGFVFQAHHLLPQCSVLENVLVPTLVRADAAEKEAARARAEDLLKRVGLIERLTHRPGQLSGGECQRVAVVRALINQPKLLLADEPTGSLDGSTAEDLGDLLVELNKEMQVTLVVVTHAPGLARRMGRVMELNSGNLAATG